MNYRIRPFASEDLAALKDIAEAAWEPIFDSFRQVLGPAIFTLLYPDWRQRQRDAVAKVCAPDSGMTVYVAEVGGAPVGFIAYEVNVAEGSGEVDLLAVHPDHQNHGIGTALNTFVLDEMKARGVRLAVVATGGDPGHAPARRSYEKAGYTGLPLVRYYKAL
jgi:GNAT superfamily N-acetyltransferase